MIVLLSVIIFLWIFSLAYSKKRLNSYFLLVALVLAVLSFFYEPTIRSDLYTHYSDLSNIRSFGWSFINSNSKFEGLFVYQWYFYFISLLPCNNFLPLITTFIVYYLPFRRIYYLSEKHQLTKKQIMAVFIFVLFSLHYSGVISGIRNDLAFSVCSYFLYIDLVENKNRLLCFGIYIAMALLHPSVAIIVFMRMMVYLSNKYLSKGLLVFLLGWTLFLDKIINYIQQFTSNAYINLLLSKLIGYTVDEANIANILPNQYYALMMFVRTIIATYICYLLLHNIKSNKYSPMNLFIGFVILYMFGSYGSYHIFLRMSDLVIFLAPIVICEFLDFGNKRRGIVYKNRIGLPKYKPAPITSLCCVMFFVIIYTTFIVNNGIQFNLFFISK